MNVIEKTRELGELLQADERYVKYHETKKKNDEDKELQDMIGELSLIQRCQNQIKAQIRLLNLMVLLNHCMEISWLIKV